MRQGGLLDHFPLFLLGRGEAHGPTIVLDAADLGRLILTPTPGPGAPVVAVARSGDLLKETRSNWDESLAPRPLLVRADPARPPFATASLAQLVTCAEPSKAWRRTVAPHGCLVILDAEVPAQRAETHTADSGGAISYVRPAVASEYFATSTAVSNPWPFRHLQLGRIRSAQLWALRTATRLGLGWGPRGLGRGVAVRVSAAPGSRGRLEPIRGECFPGQGADRGIFVKAGWNALLIGLSNGEAIGKLPLSEVAAARMTEHADQLEALHAHETPALLSVVPRVLAAGRAAGQDYWIEGVLPGAVATRLLTPGRRRRTFEASTRLLLDLHLQTGHESFIWREEFERLTKHHVERVWREGRRLDASFDLSGLLAALGSRLVGQRLPLVRTHGDFWPGNLLISADGSVSGVLDWDASTSRGWPLLDLLHLLAFQHKRRAFWSFGRTVTGRLAARRFRDWERSSVDDYCLQLGISDALWPAFVGLYWLERTSQWLCTDFHEGRRNERWLRRNVIDAVPHLLDRLGGDYSR